MWKLAVLQIIVALVLGLGANGLAAAESSTEAPQVVLAEVVYGGTGWKVVTYKGSEAESDGPCLAVGTSPNTTEGNFLFATSSGPCGLPAWGGAIQGFSRSYKGVMAFAFPRNVTSLRLDLGKPRKAKLALKLVSPELALQAQVEQFRWGYLKLSGEYCLHEIIGYDAHSHRAYRARDERAAQCDPSSVSTVRSHRPRRPRPVAAEAQQANQSQQPTAKDQGTRGSPRN